MVRSYFSDRERSEGGNRRQPVAQKFCFTIFPLFKNSNMKFTTDRPSEREKFWHTHA